ncbi:hypothetical protein [Flavobacterium franklandianum]|uniref:DUF3826 domain-containing protein n=1 Tax=Flavobacterium franklandianum TaxID=2594430 RepID=A0A553CKR2_9FLAO|nr:hypothetical protein [Flavobacterium franklandianum]TRX21118.1 hypothetical protein FNW17_09110 [Flavobacterium franklandianum]
MKKILITVALSFISLNGFAQIRVMQKDVDVAKLKMDSIHKIYKSDKKQSTFDKFMIEEQRYNALRDALYVQAGRDKQDSIDAPSKKLVEAYIKNPEHKKEVIEFQSTVASMASHLKSLVQLEKAFTIGYDFQGKAYKKYTKVQMISMGNHKNAIQKCNDLLNEYSKFTVAGTETSLHKAQYRNMTKTQRDSYDWIEKNWNSGVIGDGYMASYRTNVQ